MKKLFDLNFPLIQLPITYIGNKYFNNSGRPYLTKDPCKMPYNSYLMNRLKSDYYNKLNKNKQYATVINLIEII